MQISNLSNITIDAGDNIDVVCKVELPNIKPENISVQVYSGKIQENGTLGEINVIEMEEDKKEPGTYRAKLKLTTGGDYGYTFRVMPKHEMILDAANLNLVKWIEEN